jgi:hypothetical protein
MCPRRPMRQSPPSPVERERAALTGLQAPLSPWPRGGTGEEGAADPPRARVASRRGSSPSLQPSQGAIEVEQRIRREGGSPSLPPPPWGSSAPPPPAEPALGGRRPKLRRSRRGGAGTFLRIGFVCRGSFSALPCLRLAMERRAGIRAGGRDRRRLRHVPDSVRRWGGGWRRATGVLRHAAELGLRGKRKPATADPPHVHRCGLDSAQSWRARPPGSPSRRGRGGEDGAPAVGGGARRERTTAERGEIGRRRSERGESRGKRERRGRWGGGMG